MPAGDPEGAINSPDPISGEAQALLAELERWRDLLARDLIENHPDITEPDLNHAVFRTILCTLFLRIGEDRGFAAPGTLGLLADCDGIDRRLSRACTDAGLDPVMLSVDRPFARRPVPAVPDEALREAIRAALSPEFPLRNSAIPLFELAAVLEQYCGTMIRIAEGYRIRREGTSVVRYAGSVHVTPSNIVRYMVRETLRGSDRGTTLRILDPACGAGLFLLAFFDALAGQASGTPGRQHPARQDAGVILCRTLYGTDIDPESVAAARFVLLLAFTGLTGGPGTGRVPAERIRTVAECLQRSVRCGNALIAPDYFSLKQEPPFNAEERRKVNAFDWQEAFPEIFGDGGFDAVIGAPPPYRPLAVPSREEYFQTHFASYAPSAGLYGYFTEKGLCLLKPGGTLAFLVPGSFLRSHHARQLRRFLLSRQILAIADTGRSRTLQGRGEELFALLVRNRTPGLPFAVLRAGREAKQGDDPFSGVPPFTLDQRSLDDGGWKLADTRAGDLAAKIRSAGIPLEEYVMGEITGGMLRIRNNPFIVDAKTRDRFVGRAEECRRFFVPLLRPAEIRRYVPQDPERFVISAENIRVLTRCRGLRKHLAAAAMEAGTGPGDRGSRESPGAAGLPGLQEPAVVRGDPKIIVAPYQQVPAFAFDPRGVYAPAVPLQIIPRNDPWLAGILNSSLGRFLIMSLCPLTGRGYHLSREALGKFPVVTPDFDRLTDKSRYDKMVSLVTRMMSLHEYLQRAKTDQERRLVQQEIDATDVRIDALVYGIYGLSKDEIDVVEGRLKLQ